MLSEIDTSRSEKENRRWFRDETFNLFVWFNDAAQIARFELTSSHRGQQHVLAWDQANGVSHYRVDDEHRPGAHPATALLHETVSFDASWYREEFSTRNGNLDPNIIGVVTAAIEEQAMPATEHRSSRRSMHPPGITAPSGMGWVVIACLIISALLIVAALVL